jgi:YD repeat-containing protein
LTGIDGGITTLGIDDQGKLTSIADPAGATTLIGWNPAGLLESETDPAGNVSRFAYGNSGELSSTTDADGVIRRFDRSTGAGHVEIRSTEMRFSRQRGLFEFCS